MEKLKDFFYNSMDLILAFIIILVISISFYSTISVFFVDIFDKSTTSSSINTQNTNDTDTQDIAKQADNIDSTKANSTQDTATDNVPAFTVKSDEEIQKDTQKNQDITNIFEHNKTPQTDNNTSVVTPVADNNTSVATPTTEKKVITIDIPSNSISDDVVNILYQNGLISSKKELQDYIMSKKIDTKIKSGKFTLNTSMSKEEIMSILTK